MKIYILTRIAQFSYDEYDAKVVIAKNEMHARELANVKYGDEGGIWQDDNLVRCSEINKNREGVVLASFNAG